MRLQAALLSLLLLSSTFAQPGGKTKPADPLPTPTIRSPRIVTVPSAIGSATTGKT